MHSVRKSIRKYRQNKFTWKLLTICRLGDDKEGWMEEVIAVLGFKGRIGVWQVDKGEIGILGTEVSRYEYMRDGQASPPYFLLYCHKNNLV